jgi:hypothetical protein
MRLLNTPSSGCVFALFHQVRVTLAVVEAVLEPLLVVEGVLLELPLLHAAAAVAVVTASATAASARLLLRMVVSREGLGPRHFRKFSNTFDVPSS